MLPAPPPRQPSQKRPAVQWDMGGLLDTEHARMKSMSPPKLDNAMRLRHISLDLQRLDALLKTFFARAIEKVDAQAGLLCVKILERKAALLGLDSPQKLDVVQVQAQEGPSSFEKIHEMIMRIGRKGGNGADSAVDTLSDFGDVSQAIDVAALATPEHSL